MGDRLRWWVHNLVAHPLLVLWPRVGEWLHARTDPAVEPLLDELAWLSHAWIEARWPGESDADRIAALVEEVGELARAMVKRGHDERGSVEEWTTEVCKEWGDVVLILLDIAEREGFAPTAAVWSHYWSIRDRDKDHDPIGASDG
jgi:NTP pyrophosphatase (non-canonical NTP hydrolase)